MPKSVGDIAALFTYPLIAFACPALGWLVFHHSDGNLFLASMSATTLMLALVILFEQTLPFRAEWRAKSSEQSFKNTRLNVLYMTTSFIFQEFIVKVVLTALFIALFGLLLDRSTLGVDFWPHHWHWFPQLVVIFLLTDFFNYWTHRCLHEWHQGWALHKIHHSLEELNWSAAAKMHMLEHFLNSGPRLIVLIPLGVSHEVFLLYMLYNSAVGFIVHSNARYNTKWFNYILYTQDHHRFHHSQDIREANSNYSGPTVIWDLIFGTLYLPHTRGPDKLGLYSHENIPRWQREHSIWKSYWLQFLSPFKYWLGIDKGTSHRDNSTGTA